MARNKGRHHSCRSLYKDSGVVIDGNFVSSGALLIYVCLLFVVFLLLIVMCDKKLYLRLRINPPPFRLECLYCSMRSWLTGGCEAYRTTWRKMEP